MNEHTLTMQDFQEATDYINKQTSHSPKVALVLGSGMGPLAEEIANPTYMPYADIPHFARSTVPGHAGRLVIGTLQGQTVLAMQGRTHFYEGHSMQAITMPIRVLKLLGIETLVVTNAAGGLNPAFRVGDLMLITDHINFTGMAGHNPLRGPNFDEFGPRFPSMVTPYDLDLQAVARQSAQGSGRDSTRGRVRQPIRPHFRDTGGDSLFAGHRGRRGGHVHGAGSGGGPAQRPSGAGH